MEWEAIKNRLDTLLAAGKHSEIRGAMMMLNVVDIAQYMETLEKDKLLHLFRVLPKDISSDVFSYMEPEQKQLLRISDKAFLQHLLPVLWKILFGKHYKKVSLFFILCSEKIPDDGIFPQSLCIILSALAALFFFKLLSDFRQTFFETLLLQRRAGQHL